MIIFDIGFHIGQDTEFYLRLGHKVYAFEADSILYQEGCEKFKKEIENGRLVLQNIGIAPEEGVLEFFIHKVNKEWSTLYKDAALNWGDDKYEIASVQTITPARLFTDYGIPDYLKVDIEGYDIYIAEELKNLCMLPQFVSFEASSRFLLRNLLLAGYDSFKIVDQSLVRQQNCIIDDEVYFFKHGGTGQFGDAAPGEWLNFENIVYLYNRFEGDLFGTSVLPGHWWDIHASKGRETSLHIQLDYMRNFIATLDNHCGMCGNGKPLCPATYRK